MTTTRSGRTLKAVKQFPFVLPADGEGTDGYESGTDLESDSEIEVPLEEAADVAEEAADVAEEAADVAEEKEVADIINMDSGCPSPSASDDEDEGEEEVNTNAMEVDAEDTVDDVAPTTPTEAIKQVQIAVAEMTPVVVVAGVVEDAAKKPKRAYRKRSRKAEEKAKSKALEELDPNNNITAFRCAIRQRIMGLQAQAQDVRRVAHQQKIAAESGLEESRKMLTGCRDFLDFLDEVDISTHIAKRTKVALSAAMAKYRTAAVVAATKGGSNQKGAKSKANYYLLWKGLSTRNGVFPDIAKAFGEHHPNLSTVQSVIWNARKEAFLSFIHGGALDTIKKYITDNPDDVGLDGRYSMCANLWKEYASKNADNPTVSGMFAPMTETEKVAVIEKVEAIAAEEAAKAEAISKAAAKAAAEADAAAKAISEAESAVHALQSMHTTVLAQ